MNLVVQIGRLVADPELRQTQNGNSVATFRIAVDRQFTSENQTADFFNVVCWRKLAEVVANNLSKGRLVAVNGRLQSRSYDAQDGTRKHVIEIVADSVQFLDSKKGNGSNSNQVDSVEPDDDDVPF